MQTTDLVSQRTLCAHSRVLAKTVCDEFTNAEAGICEENDECFIPILEGGRERLGEASIAKEAGNSL